MKCGKCGNELDSDAVFCSECGTKVEKQLNHNSGNSMTDDIINDTIKPYPKTNKKGKVFLKITIAILIVIILRNVMLKGKKQAGDFQAETAETIRKNQTTESIVKDSINETIVWLEGTVGEDGETLLLEDSVDICAEDEQNVKKRKDNIKSLQIFVDTPEIGEPEVDLETIKGSKVRIGGKIFLIGDFVVIYATQAVVLEESVSEEQKIHRYILVQKDCTWDEAFKECKKMGGYLARVNTEEEWDYITRLIEEEGKEKVQFFLGARRNTNEKEYYWVDENNGFLGDRLDNNESQWCRDVWLKGEPSYYDSSVKKDEDRLDTFYYSQKGRWVFNDVPNDVLEAVPQFKGKIGYICEIEE